MTRNFIYLAPNHHGEKDLGIPSKCPKDSGFRIFQSFVQVYTTLVLAPKYYCYSSTCIRKWYKFYSSPDSSLVRERHSLSHSNPGWVIKTDPMQPVVFFFFSPGFFFNKPNPLFLLDAFVWCFFLDSTTVFITIFHHHFWENVFLINLFQSP